LQAETELKMTKWEYVTTPLLLHKETQILNTWGAQGWELVQITTGPHRVLQKRGSVNVS
jgi:hypothetical protein